MITFVFAIRFSKEITRFKGFFSLGLVHIRFAIEKQSDKATINLQMAKKAVAAKNYVLDATKRRSLMSANQGRVLGDWKEITGNQPVPNKQPEQTEKPRISQKVEKTAPLEETFNHKFFGSQLIIGEIRIGQGLAKRLHNLEITKDHLYIDNVLQEVNPGDFERIKALIRASK